MATEGAPATVTLAVEGDTDVAVLLRILRHVGLEAGPIHGLRGKGWLDQHLQGYNYAARHAPWLVLRDLNGDAPCASALLATLLPHPAPSMCFRIAVCATEAWLLADREGIAQFLGVPLAVIPQDPEHLRHPKKALVQIARKSRWRAVREDLVPAVGTSAPVGPGYTGRMVQFASESWRPAAAAGHSLSLARCLAALKRRSEA